MKKNIAARIAAMGLKKLADKLDDYNARLEAGKVDKFKPGHVEELLTKLLKKCTELEADLEMARKPDKKARTERKLGIAHKHVERAEWLLGWFG